MNVSHTENTRKPFSAIKGRERCQGTVSNPPSGKSLHRSFIATQPPHARQFPYAKSSRCLTPPLTHPTPQRHRGEGRKGGPSCARKRVGWPRRSLAILAPLLGSSGQRPGSAPDGMRLARSIMVLCSAGDHRPKRPASRAEVWVEVWVRAETPSECRINLSVGRIFSPPYATGRIF